MADQRSPFRTFDLDDSGGTEQILGVTLRTAGAAGSLEALTDAAALADDTANPTIAGIATFGMAFDGTNWDRLRGDQTDGLLVNLGTNNDVSVDELAAAAALSDALANPTTAPVGSHLMGYDRVNTNWTRIDGAVDGQVVDAASAGLLMLGTDGSNYQLLATDASGNLQVDVLSGGAGAVHVDDAAFTVTTDDVAPLGAYYDDTSPPNLSLEGDVGVVRCSVARILYNQIRDAAGNERGANVTAANQLEVLADTELAAAAALSDTFANPTTAPVGAFLMGFDGTDWERVRVTNTGQVHVEVQNASLTVDTELPAAAALSDALANPTAPAVGSHLMGYDRANTDWTRIDGLIDGQAVNAASAGFLQLGSDGSNYQALTTDAAGHLQVDVLSGGGSDTPTNPVKDYQTSATLGQGATANLTTPEAASKKLAGVEVWSSVAFKAFIHTVDNGTESTNPVAVGGGQAHLPFVYRPPHRNYVTLGATAGLDAFRVNVTNLDDDLSADVYATFYYED